jgi:STE24 endopeptidase
VARARDYHRPLYAAALARIGLDLALLGLVAFAPVGGWLFAALTGAPWWAQALGFTALIDASLTLLHLPLSFWAGFRRERRFGFSTQTLPGFLGDEAKGFAVGLVISAAVMAGLVASARVAPRAWPLLAAGGGALLVVAGSFLAPLLIEPLFHRFAPLADAALAAELGALAQRAALPVKEVLVADASRRTRKANAYVSGLGRTRRLVLYDTLLARASAAELGLVLAHELGHRRARHLVKGTALGVAGLAGFVLVLWAALGSSGLRGAIGTPGGAGDPRVVGFALLLATSLELLAAPLGAALSRSWEREADRFSLELTRDPSAFESTHRSLAVANLADLDPPRAIYLALFSHPTPAERIEAARRQVVAVGASDPGGEGHSEASAPAEGSDTALP